MPERITIFLLCMVVSLTTRLLYIFLFPNIHSFDLNCWNRVGDILLAGGNPYHDTKFLSWPPCWMQLIFLFKKISLLTHWDFDNVVRGFLMATETAVSAVLYAAIIRFVNPRSAGKYLICGIALNPIAVFQICQHGNFDVLVGFWILLAVYLLLRFQEKHDPQFWLLACFALGMGTLTKTVPLSLAPLLLLSVRRLRRAEQCLGAVLLVGPALLALSVVYVLGPADIQNDVLGYRSTPGNFGFSGLFTWWGAQDLLNAWPHVFVVLYGLGLLTLAAWLFTRQTLGHPEIVGVAALILVAIPALGPGGGLQYVYWFLPLLILQFGWETGGLRRFLLVLYGVTAVTYTLEYGFNFQTYGACLLEIHQNAAWLEVGREIASKTGETMVTLPLWLLYCSFVVILGRRIGRQIRADFVSRPALKK